MSVATPVIDYIDGETRRIYLLEGVEAFHWVEDIYTEYRNLRRTDESLRKWSPMLKASGNEAKGGGKYTPRYVTLLEGTRVIPYDENILIMVTGEAITDNPDIDPDPFDTTTRTEPLKLYITPPAAELVRAEAEIAAVNRLSFENAIHYDSDSPYSGTGGLIGNAEYPVNNIPDALIISENWNIQTLKVTGDVTLSSTDFASYSGGTIIGRGHKNTKVTIDGVIFTESTFKNCELTGTFGNGSQIDAFDCEMNNISNVSIDAHSCVLLGTIELNNSIASNFYNCTDGIPGSGTPIIEVNDCEDLGIWNYSGGIKLTNIITVGTNVSINMNGRLIVDSTDTQGSIIARGIGSINGTTGGTTITQTDLLNRSTIREEMDANSTELAAIKKKTNMIPGLY